MSWGASLVGLGNVLELLDTIEIALDDEGAVWIVGTHASYAAFVEFGTSKMGAQPYLRPAARDAQRDIGQYISSHTGTSINEFDSVEGLVKATALAIERDAKQRCPVDVGNLRASIAAGPKGEFDEAAQEAIANAPDPSALR